MVKYRKLIERRYVVCFYISSPVWFLAYERAREPPALSFHSFNRTLVVAIAIKLVRFPRDT